MYVASSAWVALEHNNYLPNLIAQIGWMHNTSSYNPFVFWQYTDNNGGWSGINSFYTTPSGTNTYQVARAPDHTFEVDWSGGGKFLPSYVNWGPDSVSLAGEVDGYNPQQANYGDHYPGNRTTPVVFSNAVWSDQYNTNHTANLTWFSGNHPSQANGATNIPPYGYTYSWSGSNFEVWDNRCS